MIRRLPRVQRAVLRVVQERGRTHAYEIKRILAGQVGHASVYAALSSMQAKGYLSAEWEIPEAGGSGPAGPPRKYFELTGHGRRALAVADEQERAPGRPVQAAHEGASS